MNLEKYGFIIKISRIGSPQRGDGSTKCSAWNPEYIFKTSNSKVKLNLSLFYSTSHFLNNPRFNQNMVGMFMIDKFFCGFFIGVILYFLIFESIINLQTPLLRYEINFLQRLADNMEALGEAVVDRRPSSVTDITDLNRDLEFHNGMFF